MTKFYYILIVALLGSFLSPTKSYACNKTTDTIEMSCSKDMESMKDIETCGKNDHSNEGNKNCEGKCGHSSCQCTSASVNYMSTDFYQYFKKVLHYKKSNSYYSATYKSSGFYSIWTPPNIG